ncbi:MAG: hypothetical protein AAGA33_06820 [Pseudomonadota bacterium]
MLALFRRHLILTVFTALAILLVLVGWWVRIDLKPQPLERPVDPVTSSKINTENAPG